MPANPASQAIAQGQIRKTAGLACLMHLASVLQKMPFDDGSSMHQIAALAGGVAAGVDTIFFGSKRLNQ
jgi:hypothetical protein